jgi:conserved oligomeric Golgi complex subunit 8
LVQAFVGTLAAAHGDVAAVARLKLQADAAAAQMLAALLARLRGPVQLPECLRVVGFLRRLAVFDEQVGAPVFCTRV